MVLTVTPFIGAGLVGWAHGDGFTLKLNYLPLNGAEIVIRRPKADEAEAVAETA